jgi:hypothetical protein
MRLLGRFDREVFYLGNNPTGEGLVGSEDGSLKLDFVHIHIQSGFAAFEIPGRAVTYLTTFQDKN